MKSAVAFKNTNKIKTPLKNILPTVNLPALLSVAVLLLISVSPSTQRRSKNMANVEFSQSLEVFGVKLFTEVAKANAKKNVVFSPFSIQTCIAMARMGAAGDTAIEMDKGMGLTVQNEESLANNYHNILTQYENSNILKIANKIYVMKNYEVKEKFNELLTKKFFSTVDSIDFGQNVQAAKTINTWVESKTNNLIKDLVSPNVLNDDTRLVLVNAIHFKGEWAHPFPEYATKEKDFYLDETNSVKVPMMHISERFRYGEFPELDAKALEMPYKNSDLSMLIILPNSRTGLVDLEEKLKSVSLHDLTSKMSSYKVNVDMPKFKAEFEMELSDVLKSLGMARMFSAAADFSNMLKSPEGLQVSKVIHKAFIEVNEKGTEAAAATAILISRLKSSMGRIHPKNFIANHGFNYYLKNKEEIKLFMGSYKIPKATVAI
ncbi:antichymotrypsin-2-like isoform X3 [Musca domestica]|uniref:Antichymotrypsin-2-like isoform X3 n=1 Tax=Musca domestica TaxID=7370 RepID=A0ABM3V7V9_MUSDO|nr:antichymotrypsin-2-like isoform X3 [Musca domestica]